MVFFFLLNGSVLLGLVNLLLYSDFNRLGIKILVFFSSFCVTKLALALSSLQGLLLLGSSLVVLPIIVGELMLVVSFPIKIH